MLRCALTLLVDSAIKLGRLSIAIPYKMGCDRGKGNWSNVVYPMICDVVGNEVDVYICKYNNNV